MAVLDHGRSGGRLLALQKAAVAWSKLLSFELWLCLRSRCPSGARCAALRMKPIMEERARVNSVASGGDRKSDAAKSGSQKSDESIKPIRTDSAVADLANLGKDTIRKIERIEKSNRLCRFNRFVPANR